MSRGFLAAPPLQCAVGVGRTTAQSSKTSGQKSFVRLSPLLSGGSGFASFIMLRGKGGRFTNIGT